MENPNKKVLVITFTFPPHPSIASVRMGGLAKYLPVHGWDPTFLTVELPGEPEEGFRVIQTPRPDDVTQRLKRLLRMNPQEGLQKQLGIPDQVSTAKKPLTGKITKRIEGWISYPDRNRYWEPIALETLRDLLSRESFDAMVSSSIPVVTHLVASKVHEEFGIPWVADFRDLWTGNHYYAYGAVRKLLDRRLELKTMAQAAALVTVSEPLARSLRSLHKGKLVLAIPNGFDPDTIQDSPLHDRFSITYTGNLYLGKRDPELLFKVACDLLRENRIQDDLEINFYGKPVYWVDNLIQKYQLDGVAAQRGFVDRAASLKEQRSSQILLSLNWDNPLEEGVYTGKIFEYLAARRPILALGGPPGVVSELLKETGAGLHLRTEEDLRSAILAWYAEYRESGSVAYHGNQKIHNFSHVKMAQRFAGLLTDISR